MREAKLLVIEALLMQFNNFMPEQTICTDIGLGKVQSDSDEYVLSQKFTSDVVDDHIGMCCDVCEVN